ncbi:MAG: PLP-dependent transferase [Phycisphaerales bacterium]|nr:PLP-dependent transferase [Phycisphaerales bacterium]
MSRRFQNPATVALHGAGAAARVSGSLAPSIVPSTTFLREGLDDAAEYAYSRVGNPTVSALESALGALEGGAEAAAFSSGLSAETTLLLATLRAGDHIACGRAVYGGTVRLLRETFTGLGVEATFFDSTNAAALAAAVRPSTRVVLVETPANPTLALTDIQGAAPLAHAAGAILIVDNTFLTPALQRPLDLGADVVVYSTTKFIEGHSVAVGGAVTTRDGALADRLRRVRKSVGTIQTPFNAWATLQGLRTLPLRIGQQSRHAARIASILAGDDRVGGVHYPGLRGFAQADIARRQHLGAHGAVVSFEVPGGLAGARAAARAVRLCSVVEHVGSVETLLTHPASMTHADVPREQREAAGVTDGLLRLSVGLEDPEDVLADLDLGIDAAAAAARSEGRPPCLVNA